MSYDQEKNKFLQFDQASNTNKHAQKHAVTQRAVAFWPIQLVQQDTPAIDAAEKAGASQV